MTPIPNTRKLEMKVNVFLKLLSLSWIKKIVLCVFWNKLVRAPNSCDWSVKQPIQRWKDQGRWCNKHTKLLGYRVTGSPGKWGCSNWRREPDQKYTREFFDLDNQIITPSGVVRVRNISNNWRGNTITNLSREKSRIRGWGLHHSFEVIKEKIEPACSHQVIDEMAHTIGPDHDFVETVKTLIFIEERGWGIRSSSFVLLGHERMVLWELLGHQGYDLRLI